MWTNTSVCTTPLTLKTAFGKHLGTGTGFWYRRSPGAELHLITNWHVITGRDPTEPHLSSNGAVPAVLEACVHLNLGKNENEQPLVHAAVIKVVSLIINDEIGEKPAWLEHPTLKFRADVVAIPASSLEATTPKLAFAAIGDAGVIDQNPLFEVSVTDDAFVIGYPWGLTGGGEALPIYKRGTVASEPTVPQGGLPRFLIDCRTASGLSGAPVIATRQVWGDKVGPGGEARFGRVGAFVGVYSGRLRAKELGTTSDANSSILRRASDEISEIGLVWQRRVLEEIVDGRIGGSKLSDLPRS